MAHLHYLHTGLVGQLFTAIYDREVRSTMQIILLDKSSINYLHKQEKIYMQFFAQ
jgi:hypothetical protein